MSKKKVYEYEGRKYAFIEDKEQDECERCALKGYSDKYGLTFATCGDEDPSFHTTEMCCGLEGLKNFENVPYCCYDTMFRIAKEKGVVTLDDMFQYYCADKEKFKEQWSSGYFMQVIQNVEYDEATNTYHYVDCNSLHPLFIRAWCCTSEAEKVEDRNRA